MTPRPRTGAATASVLAGLAGLHAYWARGGLWPGHDPASLGETVVGPRADVPAGPAVWAVAGLLGASAAAVATTTALRDPPGVARTMTRATGGVLLARGLAGIPLSLIHGLDTRFGRLNAILYSPLCVALSLGAVHAAGARHDCDQTSTPAGRPARSSTRSFCCAGSWVASAAGSWPAAWRSSGRSPTCSQALALTSARSAAPTPRWPIGCSRGRTKRGAVLPSCAGGPAGPR